MPTNINFGKKLGISAGTNIILPSVSPVPSFANTKSFLFDGVDDYITMGNDTSLHPSNFTMCVWVKPNANNSNRALIHNGAGLWGSSNHGFFLQQSYANYYFKIGDGTTSYTSFNGGLVVNTWQFITLSYDGVNMKTYLDGVLQDTLAVPNITYGTDASWNPFYMGRTSGGSQYMDGNLDEASLFNTALSQANIDTIYNSGVPNDLTSLNPLGWWRMGEEATWDGVRDWTLVDQGSGGNNGVTQNMAKASRVNDVPPNPFVNLLSTSFDGVDDYVDCGNNNNLAITNISISAWIKTTTTAGGGIVVADAANGTLRRWTFSVVQTSGTLRFYYWNTSYVTKNIVSTTAVNDGNWHHVMAINNGTDLKLYIDGVLDNSSLDGDTMNINASTYVHIGNSNYNGGWGYFDGTIDEAAIWSTDQSANVTSIYNSGVPNSLTSLNPLGWWRMGDGSTYPTINDLGSGSNDGTMTNMSAANFVADVPT